MIHINRTKGAIVEPGIAYKLTMISRNLKGVRYVSRDYHKNRDMLYESHEDAEIDGQIAVKVSREEHIMNFVDYKIECVEV